MKKLKYHWKSQPYFSANFFLNQGISSEYVMVDFIAWAYLTYEEIKPRMTKWKHSCPQ